MRKFQEKIHGRIQNFYKEALDDDVEEAVEMARLALWDAKEKGIAVANERAFSICVAKRHLGSIMRHRARYVYPDQEKVVTWSAVETWCADLTVRESSQATMDAAVVLNESPASYAEVLRKHYLEGETLEEIARETGTTSACMRKRHERALKWARKHFADEPEEER